MTPDDLNRIAIEVGLTDFEVVPCGHSKWPDDAHITKRGHCYTLPDYKYPDCPGFNEPATIASLMQRLTQAEARAEAAEEVVEAARERWANLQETGMGRYINDSLRLERFRRDRWRRLARRLLNENQHMREALEKTITTYEAMYDCCDECRDSGGAHVCLCTRHLIREAFKGLRTALNPSPSTEGGTE